MGSRSVSHAGPEPRLRRDRVSKLPAGRPEPARAEHPPRLPTRRHRRSQVPGAVPRHHRHGAERVAAGTFLRSTKTTKSTKTTTRTIATHAKAMAVVVCL